VTFKPTVYLALAMLGLAGADRALAQPFFEDTMPPRAVVGLVRASGFEPITRPVRQGRRYVLRAIDPVGTDVRIVVDAELGEILSARPLDPLAPRYRLGAPVIVAPPYARDPQLANIPPETDIARGASGQKGRAPAGMPSVSGTPAPPSPLLPRSRPVQSAKASPEPASEAKSAQNALPSNSAGSLDTVEHADPASGPSGNQTASAPPKAAVPAPPPVQPLEE
jgi:hypothetical protein